MNELENFTVKFGDEKFPVTYRRGKEVVRFLKSPTIKNRLVSIDIETYARDAYKDHPLAGLIPFLSKIRTLQAFDGDKVVILDFLGDAGEYTLLNPWIAEQLMQNFLRKHNLVAHNALFETAHLQRVFAAHYQGRNLPLDIKCTMNMFNLLLHAGTDETKGVKTALEALTQLILDVHLTKEAQRSDWSQPELTKEQLTYCARDAIAPYKLIKQMAPKLQELGMNNLYLLNTRAQEPVAHMRINGIAFDSAAHQELIEQWKEKHDQLWIECSELLNTDKWKLSAAAYHTRFLAKVTKGQIKDMEQLLLSLKGQCDFSTIQSDMRLLNRQIAKETDTSRLRALKRVLKNIKEFLVSPDSNRQLSNWFKSELTAATLANWPISEKSGDLKMDYDTLEEFSHIPVAAKLMEYSEYAKLYSTYGTSLQEHVIDTGDYDAIFPSFSLCFTGTGRMSSFAPNLQNLPRDKSVRALFIPRNNDRKLLCADFSQIELRVLAILSEDEVMLQAYEDGQDLHTITAANFARVEYDEVSKEQRQGAKGINFGLIYGAGPTTLRKYCKSTYGVVMEEEEAEEAVAVFRALYPQVRQWQLSTAAHAEQTLEVTTPSGKIRRLPSDGTYSASMNTKVQGGAAEVMLEAMIRIWDFINSSPVGGRAFLVNVVHDEMTLDVHEDDVDVVKEAMERCMTEAFLEVFPGACVRGLVEVKVCNNWSEK